MTPRQLYRRLATAEMVTWTGLLLGMVLKYSGVTEVGVQIAGLTHGVVFLAYGATAIIVGLNQRWSLKLIMLGIASAFVPYVTYPFDRWLERNQKLEGPWRPASTDPQAGFLERIRSWVITHPLIAVVVVIIGISAMTSFLLWLGPPTGWATRFTQ